MKSAQQAKAAEMSFEEQKTFTATKEDLELNTTDIPVVMQTTGACDSEGTEKGGHPTASIQ